MTHNESPLACTQQQESQREAYLFGDLTGEQLDSFTTHLQGCHACQQEVTAHQQWTHAFQSAATQTTANATIQEQEWQTLLAKIPTASTIETATTAANKPDETKLANTTPENVQTTPQTSMTSPVHTDTSPQITMTTRPPQPPAPPQSEPQQTSPWPEWLWQWLAPAMAMAAIALVLTLPQPTTQRTKTNAKSPQKRSDTVAVTHKQPARPLTSHHKRSRPPNKRRLAQVRPTKPMVTPQQRPLRLRQMPTKPVAVAKAIQVRQSKQRPAATKRPKIRRVAPHKTTPETTEPEQITALLATNNPKIQVIWIQHKSFPERPFQPDRENL